MHELHDSGKREAFNTGAHRDTREGKGRYDLISPYFLHRLALVMEKGARKYEARNWEKGFPYSRCLDSAVRHIEQFLTGARDEDHLAQAAFNLMVITHFEELRARGLLKISSTPIDDLPHYGPPKEKDNEGNQETNEAEASTPQQSIGVGNFGGRPGCIATGPSGQSAV